QLAPRHVRTHAGRTRLNRGRNRSQRGAHPGPGHLCGVPRLGGAPGVEWADSPRTCGGSDALLPGLCAAGFDVLPDLVSVPAVVSSHDTGLAESVDTG